MTYLSKVNQNQGGGLVSITTGKPLTSSRTVAEYFGKVHKNVLRDIENLGASEEFNRLNFELVDYKDAKGEMRPEYLITKNGFVLLVMGYTGQKAMQFKEAYIGAFDKMEDALLNSKDRKRLEISRMEELPKNINKDYEALIFAAERKITEITNAEYNYSSVTGNPLNPYNHLQMIGEYGEYSQDMHVKRFLANCSNEFLEHKFVPIKGIMKLYKIFCDSNGLKHKQRHTQFTIVNITNSYMKNIGISAKPVCVGGINGFNFELVG